MKFIDNNVCSLDNAKLLKEAGFDEITKTMYCTDVRYKGKSISFEEELDLKAKGKENEIEHVKFGKTLWITNKNGEYADTYSAPTIEEAIDWIRRTFDIYITVVPEFNHLKKCSKYVENVYYFEKSMQDYAKLLTPKYFNSFEECNQYAINKTLEYLKTFKNER